MTIKELVEKLKKFDDDIPVCYVNEESGGEDEVEEIQPKLLYGDKRIILLAREGCFG